MYLLNIKKKEKRTEARVHDNNKMLGMLPEREVEETSGDRFLSLSMQ
jgi:hypothetical protein